MTKKILLSTTASMVLAGSLMAAESEIRMGSDINGTIQNIAVATAAVDVNISSASNGNDANWVKGINYIPEIGIGKGNLITVKVDNGYLHTVDANNLYLVDINSTDSNATSGTLVVAKMTDFAKSSDNRGYKNMTFKFEQEVDSQDVLAFANVSETNATLQADGGKRIAKAEHNKLALVANKGLKCGDMITLSVIDSTDQSGGAFPVANANPTAGNGMQIITALSIDKASSLTGDISASGTACPTFSCSIALPDEKSFGSVNVSADCPTCEEKQEPTFTCDSGFILDYTAGSLGTNATLSSIDFTLTTTDTSAISSIKSNLDATGVTYAESNNDVTATKSANVYSASVSHGIAPQANNRVFSRITVDGSTVIAPRTFDLAVKVNQNLDVDTVSNHIKFEEQGTPLTIAYMSANPNYRTFVRVTTESAATIQAVITTEDGQVSDRFDTGYATTAAGAVVVEAATLMEKAKDAGFTGTGNRFNTTLFVKTVGAVDAVAYQTAGASGSQRYLPVGGATGGGVN